MVNFCLSNEEKALLKSLIGKKLINFRHDPLDKLGKETVYGRIELFFNDSIVLLDYGYKPYPLFGNEDDDHPMFLAKIIDEKDAISALKDVTQINVEVKKGITGITLVEDYAEITYDDKADSLRILKAIIFKFGKEEIAIQGDYMIPLLDIMKGENVASRLANPGDEFENDPETKFIAKRFFVEL